MRINCACQNQINKRIIEPNSKQKATVMYTFGVLLLSGVKANEQREDRRTDKQLNGIENNDK